MSKNINGPFIAMQQVRRGFRTLKPFDRLNARFLSERAVAIAAKFFPVYEQRLKAALFETLDATRVSVDSTARPGKWESYKADVEQILALTTYQWMVDNPLRYGVNVSFVRDRDSRMVEVGEITDNPDLTPIVAAECHSNVTAFTTGVVMETAAYLLRKPAPALLFSAALLFAADYFAAHLPPEPLPYAYYIVLRVIVFLSAVYYSINAFQLGGRFAPLIFAFLALTFNPIFPVILPVAIWRWVDLTAAWICVCAWLTFLPHDRE